jgi:hypothetical protein
MTFLGSTGKFNILRSSRTLRLSSFIELKTLRTHVLTITALAQPTVRCSTPTLRSCFLITSKDGMQSRIILIMKLLNFSCRSCTFRSKMIPILSTKNDFGQSLTSTALSDTSKSKRTKTTLSKSTQMSSTKLYKWP